MNNITEEFRARPATSIVTAVLLFALIIAFIASFLHFNWAGMIVIFLIILLICLPRFVEKFSKIVVPAGIQIFLICFTFASLFLGDYNHYYSKYFWWDTVLHASSGLAFAIVGFLALYLIANSSTLRVNPWTIAIFSFCFSLAIGAVWEILEFTLDQMFGLNLQAGSLGQVNSLFDTMKDLIADACGALIASLLGYFYLKKKRGSFVNPLMVEFKEDNPELFKKKKAKYDD